MDSSDVRCATGICTRTSVVNINISDIMDEVRSTGGLFADDCVIYREVSQERCKRTAERLGEDFKLDKDLAVGTEYREMPKQTEGQQSGLNTV